MKIPGLRSFALLIFALSFAFLTLEKSAAQNSNAEAPEISRRQFAGAIKTVPQAIKNAKSAGAFFEERNLFHSTTKNAADDARLRSIVGGGVTFDLNKTEARKILDETPEFLALALPDGRGGTINLELEKADIFADGFSVKTSAAANESAKQNLGAHYRGIVKGDERSLAAISIFKNEVMGFYSNEASGNFVLGRLGGENSSDRHILYAEKDLKVKSDFHCETKDEGAALPETSLREQSSEVIARCMRIYLEANHDLFLNKGSVAAVTNYLTGMFNQSAALFANEGVSVSLSEIFVWNSPSPFDQSSSSEVLNQFRTFRTSFNGDVAHLITLDRQFGGISYLDSLCNRSLSYGISDIDPNFENVPTYSWSVYAFTHETGHMLGSPHTHACAWNGNNTAIDSCGPEAGYPYEGNCSGASLPPPNGGTIMSYCHRNVGINFSLGFGVQPRNVILNKVNSSVCLADCGSDCSITLSPAESPVFSPLGGNGAFNILTGNGCAWEVFIGSQSSPLNIFSSHLRQENIFSTEKPAVTSLQTPPDAQIAPAAVFTDSAQILLPDRTSNLSTVQPRKASPYPSSITVSGMNGTVTRVRVRLNGLNHAAPDDLDILLVGPGGRSVLLMSDAGGYSSAGNVRLIFDQTAPELPNDAPLVSGTYRPTNFPGNPALEFGGQDFFQPTAPVLITYSSNLETFNGMFPNGSWRLFILDDEHFNSGNIIEGWTLEINTTGGSGDWIFLTSASSGSGTGTVNYRVSENTDTSARAGTFLIRGRTYTIRQDTPFTSPSRTPFDYDGDGKSDISVFRPSNGYWYISNSSDNSLSIVQFGAAGDLIAPADFDGDGKTDISVFRPSDGGWYRLNSSNNTFSAFQFGTNGDLPVPGDFDGDGKADISVFRPASGSWYRLDSSTSQFVAAQFGASGDQPLVGDFDGDGKSDLGVFRASDGGWYRLNSADDTFSATQFGIAEDKPVAADFDGDGRTDLAVYRPSNGYWYRIDSSNDSFNAAQFGISEDKPAPADYDGDGKADLAVWRPSSGTWYLLRTTQGFTGAQFGSTDDIPTPNAFVR